MIADATSVAVGTALHPPKHRRVFWCFQREAHGTISKDYYKRHKYTGWCNISFCSAFGGKQQPAHAPSPSGLTGREGCVSYTSGEAAQQNQHYACLFWPKNRLLLTHPPPVTELCMTHNSLYKQVSIQCVHVFCLTLSVVTKTG